jgi:hypothetical protein
VIRLPSLKALGDCGRLEGLLKTNGGNEMTEIDLIVDGKNIREFEMDCLPKQMEILDIDFDEYKGKCIVTEITHVIFTEKDSNRVKNYVKLRAVSGLK